MEINDMLSNVLRDAGYEIYLDHRSGADYCFEDDSTLGQIRIYDTPDDLLTYWRQDQDRFLRAYASLIRSAGPKSWNIYTVLISSQAAAYEQLPSLRTLPDDLAATRKICGTGIETEQDCIQILLPLLPIQYESNLVRVDVTSEIQSRLNLSTTQLQTLLHSNSVDELIDAMVPDQ